MGNLFVGIGFQQYKHFTSKFQMTYTICRNDILVTNGLCFHISCFIRIFLTTPFFELVKTVDCMLYIVQKAM